MNMSSDHFQDFITSGRHEAFDDTQIDPFIRRVFEKIDVYNQLIKDRYLTSVEINEIMNELDSEWQELLHASCRVTGVISFKPPRLGGDKAETIVDYYDGMMVEFGGVLPIEESERVKYGANDDGSDQTEHTYMLGLRFILHGKSAAGISHAIEGAASIEDIIALGFPDNMSLEGARKWLAYYHATDLEDLELDLLNNTEDECRALMELAGHAVELGARNGTDDWSIRQSTQALDLHTNSLISLDRHVPYTLSVDGFAWDILAGGGREQAYAYGTNTIAGIHRISWLPSANGTDNILMPHANVDFYGEDRVAPVRTMAVPIAAFTDLQSLRRQYFASDSDTSSSK